MQEANRLWILKNAYVTLGKRIRKRPALRLATTGLLGSYGLEAINGTLTVFASKSSGFVAPTAMNAVLLDENVGEVLVDVVYAKPFSGYPYVVGKYKVPGVIQKPTFNGSGSFISTPNRLHRHHYVDGSPSTLIADANCPTAESVVKAASRMFAINGETVRYCTAGNPRDWTTAEDAGFLPVSLQQDTKAGCTGVGTFGENLVVFFEESAQIWKVAIDPSANELTRRIEGVGTAQPFATAGFANDLMFLSPYGFRSMTVQAQTDRVDDTDVGVAIDKLVVPDLASVDPLNPAMGVWIHELGQYWAIFPGTTSKAWVYSYSRSSKIACWSEYTLPINVTGVATVAGRVYLRTSTDLYQLSESDYTDFGASIPVEVQMAFQNAKTPGVEKQFYGADYVFEGTCDVSFKYDPRDLDKETISQAVSGDTAAGQMVPVEVVCPSLAPVFRHEADEAFELSAATIYYSPLTVS